jgi:hypothetical protein
MNRIIGEMIKSICNDCRQIIWVSKSQKSIHLCTGCSYQRYLDKKELVMK